MRIDRTISQKKRFLSGCIKKPMKCLAKECADDWGNPEQLTRILHRHYQSIPNCQLLYCFNVVGKQFSASVSEKDINMSMLGREIKQRPYFQGLLPFNGMALSSIYLSQGNEQPCITALFAVKNYDDLLGFVAADFYISDLPRIGVHTSLHKNQWTQYKGDPSIRNTVFMQQRTISHFDQRMERVIYTVSTLLKKHGVFHMQIDFSSSRLVAWSVEAPFDYQVLSVDDLFSNELMQSYSEQDYPADAVVSESKIDEVLMQFKALRKADETIYLRSGTLNIINGTVGLTFSCDGFHLMTVDEFLNKDIDFWIGSDIVPAHNWYDMPLKEIA